MSSPPTPPTGPQRSRHPQPTPSTVASSDRSPPAETPGTKPAGPHRTDPGQRDTPATDTTTPTPLPSQPAPGPRPCPCGCTVQTAPGAEPDWHDTTGPDPLLRRRHGTGDIPAGRPRWADHTYRLRHPDGRCTYVAEPYSLDDDALADLAWLTHNGYTVAVTARDARHFPGRTLAITITTRTSP